MSTHEFAIENQEPLPQRRVVEAEIKLPKIEGVKLPEVDLAPVRKVAEDVLLTSLGVGVLAVRGVAKAVRAAYRAGVDELEHPSPVTRAVLEAVRGQKATPPEAETAVKVPVMPIEDYDGLTAEEVIGRLDGLDAAGLRVIRDYENEHKARVTVLRAIDARLETA